MSEYAAYTAPDTEASIPKKKPKIGSPTTIRIIESIPKTIKYKQNPLITSDPVIRYRENFGFRSMMYPAMTKPPVARHAVKKRTIRPSLISSFRIVILGKSSRRSNE
jgi:hypothetical protein